LRKEKERKKGRHFGGRGLPGRKRKKSGAEQESGVDVGGVTLCFIKGKRRRKKGSHRKLGKTFEGRNKGGGGD